MGKRLFTSVVLFVLLLAMVGSQVLVVYARGLSFQTESDVYLTARVQNKWWYAGNLKCTSATMETFLGTYEGEIQEGNWWGLAGNESCEIIFRDVTADMEGSADITVTYYTTVFAELIDMLTNDRLQTQTDTYYIDQVTWYDDYRVLDDMILQDTSTVPVIQYDPTALPDLPDIPGAPAP